MKKAIFLITIFSTVLFANNSNSNDAVKIATTPWLSASAAAAIGLAVLGGTYAQGKTASAALEGMTRNPNSVEKTFTPLLLCMALIESLVLFGLVVAFIIINKF